MIIVRIIFITSLSIEFGLKLPAEDRAEERADDCACHVFHLAFDGVRKRIDQKMIGPMNGGTVVGSIMFFASFRLSLRSD